jgi:Tudor domain
MKIVQVLTKAGENWKVSFVDYGNTSEVSIADIRPLKEEHASLPVQGINCILRGCSKSDWSHEEIDKFDAVTKNVALDVIYIMFYFFRNANILFIGNHCGEAEGQVQCSPLQGI